MMHVIWTALFAGLLFPNTSLANQGPRGLDFGGSPAEASHNTRKARAGQDPRALLLTLTPTPRPVSPSTPRPSLSPSPVPSRAPTPRPTLPRPAGPGGGAAARSLVYLQGSASEKQLPADVEALLSSSGRVSGVSECDDTPMFHVPLDFTFLYAGGRFRHLWLNPNGMVFFAPLPPCDAYFSAGTPCDFDSGSVSSYYGGYVTFIAAFGSDFNPAATADAVVEWAQDAGRIVVRWRNLALYGSSWNQYEFSLELRASGLVRIHHTTVTP